MSQKITCRSKEFKLTLNCDSLDRNLFKMLNLLNQIGLLYCLPEFIEKKPKKLKGLARFRKPQAEQVQKPLQQIKYTIHAVKAMRIIWRSAALVRQFGATNQQMRMVCNNRHVGHQNDLEDIIRLLEKKISIVPNSKQNKPGIAKSKANVQKLKKIKQSVEKIWSSFDYEKLKEKRKIYSLPLSLFQVENMDPQDKEKIIMLLQRQLIEIDVTILRQSLKFIQELQTGHCIVTLEQSYPSFMVYKNLFREIVGPKYYEKALRELMLAKQECFKRGLTFKPSRFVMCHQCGVILFKVNAKEGYQCFLNARQENLTDNPYGYQQIILQGNYSYIYELEKERSKSKGKIDIHSNQDFKKYRHPYGQLFEEKCFRFYCVTCKQKEESKAKDKNKGQQQVLQLKEGQVYSEAIAEKIKLLKKCPFCQLRCACQRCLLLISFNQMMAFYEAIGGRFLDLLPELMFLNLEGQKVYLQHINFQNQAIDDNMIQEAQFIQLPEGLEDLPLPQQVIQLEQLLATEQNEWWENPNDNNANQIYPNVQKMFEDLIIAEDQDNRENDPYIMNEEMIDEAS